MQKDLVSPEKVPGEVLYLKCAAHLRMPVGVSTYERIINQYPEHFKEEHEHRRKWAQIPQSVHDAYHEEYEQLTRSLYDSVPHWGKGLWWMMQNLEHESEFREGLAKIRPEVDRIKEELKAKYYKPYGVEPAW